MAVAIYIIHVHDMLGLVSVMSLKMSVLLCLLLWSLVEVHSQTEFPYVSFMGETLPNHAFVNLTEVGNPALNDDDHSVQCHTDLSTCCGGTQGIHRADWYFPDGSRLPFPGPGHDIAEARGAQRIDIRRNNNANSPSGIYRCDITTDAVQDNSVRETVYVGLYATGGEQYILVCINGIALKECLCIYTCRRAHNNWWCDTDCGL